MSYRKYWSRCNVKNQIVCALCYILDLRLLNLPNMKFKDNISITAIFELHGCRANNKNQHRYQYCIAAHLDHDPLYIIKSFFSTCFAKVRELALCSYLDWLYIFWYWSTLWAGWEKLALLFEGVSYSACKHALINW